MNTDEDLFGGEDLFGDDDFFNESNDSSSSSNKAFEDTDDIFGSSSIDNDTDNATKNVQSNKAVQNSNNKNAIIIIGIGIAVILCAVLVSRIGTKKKTNNNKNINSTVNESVKDKWSAINDDDIKFYDTYEENTFSIENIERVGRQNGNSIEVIAILTGTLSNHTGTYQIRIPYNKSKGLKIGQQFNVYVQIGKYKDINIIGEIRYY